MHEGNLRNDVDTTFNTTPVVTQPSDNDFLSFGWRSSLSSKLSNELTGGSFYSRPFFFSSEPAKTTNFIVPTLVTNPESTFLNQGRKVRTSNVNETRPTSWAITRSVLAVSSKLFRLIPRTMQALPQPTLSGPT